MNNRPLSIQEILKHVFNNETGRLKATLNSSQDYLNAVYDESKDAIRINLDGGGDGGSILIQVDNETIEKNQNGEIQAIGIKETNLGTSRKFWIGTQEQYEQQNKSESNDICIIADGDKPIYLTGTIDSELDEDSVNPVQNQAIAKELNKKVDKEDFDELEETTSWHIVG